MEIADTKTKVCEIVSMKSGLEDRNNLERLSSEVRINMCLNEVRPGRPEQ